MNFKKFGLVSSFAIVAAMSSPAFAQDDTAGDQQDANRTNEIIVTAEFREAKLQDTPIAITAVNAEMLEARGATDVAAIAAQAPNVVLKPQGQASGTGLIAYIRGVGQTDFIYARDPGVGVYIDDVYIPTLQSSLIELMDLERVEVLRGPQGTLAGKNSIGGSIKLFGKKPTGNDSGALEVSYGSFNDVRLRGFADFAITDNMAVRISGMSRSTNGYVTFLDYGLTHPTSNVPSNQSIGQFPTLGKAGGRTITAGRVALNYDPVDNLNIYVTADYTSQRGDPGAEVLIAAGRPSGGGFVFDGTGQNPAVSFSPNATTQVPWLVGKNGQAVTVGCQFVPYGSYSCDTPPSGYDPKYISYANYLDASPPSAQAPYKPYFAIPVQNFKGWGVHGTLTYDLSDNFQIVSITSYRKYTSTWGNDNDLTPVPVQQLNNINRHHAFSQELRLNFEVADGLVDGTVGGFYFDQYGEYEARVDLNYVNPTIDFIHGPDETPSKSKAVFANINVHPTEALTITGGIRYSDESKDYVYYRRNPDYTKVTGCPPGPPSFSVPNCLVNGFFGTLGAFAATRTDYRGVINYRISPALMVYASLATGFKGGGVNPRPFIPDQALPFNPETLTTYEGGFKADLLDRRLRLNGAVFYNKYKDVQGTKLACPESALVQPCARPDNIGDAKMTGFELETTVIPVDGLSIDGSLAYLDFEYTSALQANGNLVNTSIPGTAVTPFTPKWTWSIGTQYDYDLASGSMLSFRLDGSYQSKVYANSENSFFATIDSYFLLNGRIAFSSPDDKWQVYGEVKNITDKYYFLTKGEATTAGTVVGQPGIPRTWTVGVKRKF